MGCGYAAGMAATAAGGWDHRRGGHGRRRPLSGVFHAGLPGSGGLWCRGAQRALGPDAAQVRAFPRGNAVVAARSGCLSSPRPARCRATMSTADARRSSLGRTLYAIPGSNLLADSSGTNRLAAEGARIIPDETSLELAISMDFGVARFCSQGERPAAGPVLSALVACPSRPDELAARLNEDVLTLLRTLTDHEARGLVERLPDGRYSPTKEYLLGQNG